MDDPADAPDTKTGFELDSATDGIDLAALQQRSTTQTFEAATRERIEFLHEQDVESAYHLAIYDLVARDGLTEIFNKRKYEEEVQREFARAVRHHRPLSLILFDLDEFKQINDSYGHLCGDFVLKQVASLARDLTRPEEVLARVGGDEFAILTPETAIPSAETLPLTLRDRIEGFEHRYGEVKIAVRCSCGVAELVPEMINPQDLYQAAHAALLVAKRSGRNRVKGRTVPRAPA